MRRQYRSGAVSQLGADVERDRRSRLQGGKRFFFEKRSKKLLSVSPSRQPFSPSWPGLSSRARAHTSTRAPQLNYPKTNAWLGIELKHEAAIWRLHLEALLAEPLAASPTLNRILNPPRTPATPFKTDLSGLADSRLNCSDQRTKPASHEMVTHRLPGQIQKRSKKILSA